VCVRGYRNLFKTIGLYSILKVSVDMWRKVSFELCNNHRGPIAEEAKDETVASNESMRSTDTNR